MAPPSKSSPRECSPQCSLTWLWSPSLARKREKANVVDPSTRQRSTLNSGSNYSWMNRDGKTISTDHSTYDPNLDDHMNQQHWQKLENAE